MRQLIIRELLKPIVRRVGSLMAGGLLTYGIAEDQVLEVQEGLIAAALIGLDLLSSYWERKQ